VFLQSLEVSLEVAVVADPLMPRATLVYWPLLLVKPEAKLPVPDYVSKLGGPASRYYRALETLAALDAYEAQVALQRFKSKARAISRMPVPPLLNPNLTLAVHKRNFWLGMIEGSDVCPIHLDPGKRWKLDVFGMLALQLVLWIWCSRIDPDPDRVRGLTLAHSHLPVFEQNDSAHTWWRYAKGFLHDSSRRWCDEEGVRALIPVSCQASSATRNTYFLRKVRERFLSFAPPQRAQTHR